MPDARVTNSITGRDAFLRVLSDEGVVKMFGNPGTTELPIMHALSSAPQMGYVLGLQEAVVIAMADDALLDRLARLPCWQGKVSLEPLTGGLTNLSFVAEDRGEKFVVRCGGDIPVHHVFRDRERAASRSRKT